MLACINYLMTVYIILSSLEYFCLEFLIMLIFT